MIAEIAKLHIRALPHTWNSRRGERWVGWLYRIVQRLGYVKTVSRQGLVVGVIAGVGQLILTLVVAPEWQRKGVGSELLAGMEGKRLVYTEDRSVGFYEKAGFKRMWQWGNIIFLWRK